MTYGDGIWLIGFVRRPNGETNHAEGEALNTQQEIWMRYRLAEKCVIRSAHLKVLCVTG